MQNKNIDDIFPLSPMQRLMLIHSLTASGSLTLSNQFRYRLNGELDIECFRKAWQRIVDRHQALRTCFVWEGLNDPVQVVRKSANLPFTYVDLGNLDDEEREIRLNDLQDSDRYLPFDLRRAPLMRLTLIRLAERAYQMLWSRHHLILDRWCVDLLFDELFESYRAAKSSTSPTLGAAASFRQYIDWIHRQDRAGADDYWSRVLRGFERPTYLLPERRSRSRGLEGGLPTTDVKLPPALYRSLRSLARDCAVTVATVLQGAVALLLSARTGETDVLFGLTVSGRPPDLPDVDTMMGSFMNNVPVRIQVDSKLPMRDWLQTIHRAQAGRFRFEYVSPADIRRCTGLSGDAPLYDVLTLLHAPETEIRQGPDFEIEQVAAPLDTTYPITLGLSETLGELRFVAAYDPMHVDGRTARQVLIDLQALLNQMLEARDAPVASVLRRAEGPGRPVTAAPKPENVASKAPRDADSADEEAILGSIWCEALGLDEIGPDEDFFALGGTSIQAALAFSRMEERLGRALPLSLLFNAGSIRAIMAELQRPQSAIASLVEIQPRGSRPQLFVVPGIGGNVVGLEKLARLMGPDQPFFGLQSKGLDGREQPLRDLEQIAAAFIAEMRPKLRDPYVLFGNCWGAVVAFEMARQLGAAGRPAAVLIMLDPVFPAIGSPRPKRRTETAAKLGFMLARARIWWAEFRTLDRSERRRWLREKRALIGDMIRHRDPFRGNLVELNQHRVSAANLEALTRYRPVPYDGTARVLITRDRAHDIDGQARDRWRELVSADCEAYEVRGADTGDTLSAENINSLAGVLTAEIARAGQRVSGVAKVTARAAGHQLPFNQVT